MGEIHGIGTPLADVKTEMATLGAMLVSDGHPLDCREEVVDKLRDAGADAFYDPDHKLIYQAIIDCLIDERPTDPISVVSRLRTKGELTQGLFDLVHELPRSAGVMTSAADDAAIILDLYRKRELHRVLLDCDNQTLKAAGSYEEIAGEVSSSVMSVVDRAVRPDTLYTAIEVVDRALGHLFGEYEEEPGIPMGIPDLDNLTGGMRPGQMIVIAGRPGHGKTTLGAQVARNTSNSGVPTAFFSLEMPIQELGQRNAAAETGVAFTDIRDKKVDSKGLEQLARYADAQENRPLFVDDNADQSVGEITLKTRKLIREYGVKVVVVDYLQLVKPDGGGTGNKTQDIADVSDGLRKMARKLGITVIALAQLNRGVASREDSKPKITDLRQSGEIEEDANIVILVHLEFKVNPETEREKFADIILAKNRGGITSEIEMYFDGPHNRFLDPESIMGVRR